MLDPPASRLDDDALTQRSRARLFAVLSGLLRPATTAELAQAVGLRPNGTRAHLATLQAAGLVHRTRSEGRRGRPADLWAVAAGARPGGGAPSAYRELAVWLARAVGAGATQPAGMRDAGRDIGRELIDGDDRVEGRDGVEYALSAMGFAPRRHMDCGRMVLRLGNCPYREAASENQPVICALHQGITEGLLDALMPGARLTGFVAHDPDAAGCIVEIDTTRAAPV